MNITACLSCNELFDRTNQHKICIKCDTKEHFNVSYYTNVCEYLGNKLGLSEHWMSNEQDFLCNKVPNELIATGYGNQVLNWLEVRLDLVDGAGL